jgi:hypothetical protein
MVTLISVPGRAAGEYCSNPKASNSLLMLGVTTRILMLTSSFVAI